jgi:hypothetical protein
MNGATKRAIAVAALAGSLMASTADETPVRAEPAEPENSVLEWNMIATTAIVVTAEQPPHVASISFAMVQGAVYDAVNAIDGGFSPYLEALTADRSYSQDAAAATAAFGALAGLFPDQLADLQAAYDTTLVSVPDGPAKTGGIEVGDAAAAAMLAARTDDSRGGEFTFVFGTEPGQWRTAPPANTEDPAPWVANVTPFVVADVADLRTAGPLALDSDAYAAEFDEVKELGSLTSTKRTADQTEAAIFWQAHGVAVWNAVFRELATSGGLDVADSARLLAITNLAGADSAIGCWNDKYHWNFWRPITAIREAADDGNPATEPDPNWLPLFDPSTPVQAGTPLTTPGFPDHPSGHGCISGAYVSTLQNFSARTRSRSFSPAHAPAPPAASTGSQRCCKRSSTPGSGPASTSAPQMCRALSWARTSPPFSRRPTSNPSSR